MGNIPFIDLRAGTAKIRKEIDEAIARIIDNTSFVLGPEVEGFEKEFAGFCGASYCTGTSSGTSALHLALLGCGVGPGYRVGPAGLLRRRGNESTRNLLRDV